jgi:hypothetical protein
MRPIYTMVMALVFVSTAALAMTPFNGDDSAGKFLSAPEPTVRADDVKTLYNSCLNYASAKDPDGSLFLTFSNKLSKRVDTRMSDANVAQMDAYQQIALEWLQENEAKLTNREEQTILHACFYVKALLKAKVGLPDAALHRMTKVACYKLVRWLDANVAVINGVQTVMAMVE